MTVAQNIKIIAAINALVPGAEFTLQGGQSASPATLTWLDARARPTDQQITDQITAMNLDAVQANNTVRIAGIEADSNVVTLLNQISTMTTAQIDTWMTNNVTTLAQARTVLAATIKVVALLYVAINGD